MQALLDSIIGVPLPTEITITMDPGGTSGSAVMTVDMSPLSGGAGDSANDTYPLTFTYIGNELTFTEPSSEGLTFVMTGTVSREGQNLVMSGVGSSSGGGTSETVTWKVTKRVGL